MKIFKDLFTGAELFSDAYDITIIDNVVYQIKGKSRTDSVGIDESKLGANPSAEGSDEGATASASISGVDFILGSELQQIGLAKSDFKTYIQGYCKKLLERLGTENADRVPAFKAGAKLIVDKLFKKKFDNLSFYVGNNEASLNLEGAVGVFDFDEDDQPMIWFFIDGVVEEKC